jgi:hypothetical protein
MPPRRGQGAAAAAAAPQPSALSPLPLPLVLHVFGLLPVDARARAACVSRGWCATLLDLSLWTRLNLSPSSGVRVRVTDAVLAGAARKARGQLAALDVRHCDAVTFDALLAVVRANGGALRELRVVVLRVPGMPQHTTGAVLLERLVQAAPQLTACHADVYAVNCFADARRMLRNEPPFQPLRLHALSVNFEYDADGASTLAFAADVAAHASLQRLSLRNIPLATHGALDVVVDAALARRLESLNVNSVQVSPASALALARLLASTALTALSISGVAGVQLLDGAAAALLSEALRANHTLTSVSFTRVHLWRDPDAAAELLSALTGHPSVRSINLAANDIDAAHEAAAGTALGALVAANAPALTALLVSHGRLGDAGLGALCAALPANTHLQILSADGNATSAAFARDVLLPAVRANTSLHALPVAAAPGMQHAGWEEAAAFVAAHARRAAADAV